MRDWLNAILAFIGAESLTDGEYNGINFTKVTNGVYDQGAYDELAKILAAREAVSTTQQRLVAFFKAKGTDVEPVQTGKSNIYLGDVL